MKIKIGSFVTANFVMIAGILLIINIADTVVMHLALCRVL